MKLFFFKALLNQHPHSNTIFWMTHPISILHPPMLCNPLSLKPQMNLKHQFSPVPIQPNMIRPMTHHHPPPKNTPDPSPPANQHQHIISNPPHNPNPVSIHPMVIRFHVGTNRLTKRLNMHVSSVSPLLKTYHDDFSDLNWQNAVRDEYTAIIKNGTCTLVPRPTDTNIIHSMCLFCHKYLADGTLSRYKALLVANGSNQLEGMM